MLDYDDLVPPGKSHGTAKPGAEPDTLRPQFGLGAPPHTRPIKSLMPGKRCHKDVAVQHPPWLRRAAPVRRSERQSSRLGPRGPKYLSEKHPSMEITSHEYGTGHTPSCAAKPITPTRDTSNLGSHRSPSNLRRLPTAARQGRPTYRSRG